MTLSRSDSVRRALLAPRRDRRPQRVVVLESWPGREGRTFARELRRAGLPTSVVPDGEGRRRVTSVDLVVIGADTVFEDGSILHKVGTRALALAARRARVPVVVVAGRSKRVAGRRPARGVPRLFDRTSARAISEYWTDEGPVASAKWSRHVTRAR